MDPVSIDPTWWQAVIAWFNSWPKDNAVLAWASQRIVILYCLLKITQGIANITPWAWDNAVVGVIRGIVDTITRSRKGNGKSPDPVK